MDSILLVEDDATLAHAIARNLAVRGYRVRSAATVAEAIQALKAEPPALLILDIELPDGSGWEVLRALRAGGHHEAAVIAMSALRPNARLVKELGCAGTLEKPFPMESLLRLVALNCGQTDVQMPAEPDLES